jgi:hypothetical protein
VLASESTENVMYPLGIAVPELPITDAVKDLEVFVVEDSETIVTVFAGATPTFTDWNAEKESALVLSPL